MLKKFKSSNHSSNQGFTIIEVLIVLAIAALILLIIFLAVPALQRNSRNTTRKRDVAAILAGMVEFLNNNGNIPTACSGNGTIIWGNSPKIQSETKVGYYNAGCLPFGSTPGQSNVLIGNTGAGVTAGTFNDSAHDYVQVTPQTTCNSADAVVGGSIRAISAVYALETTSGTYTQDCVST